MNTTSKKDQGTTYHCMHTRPVDPYKEWVPIVASSPEEAANQFHLANRRGVWMEDGSYACFSVVEVLGHGEFVSRIFVKGIGRAGGVRPANLQFASSLDAAAKLLKVDTAMLNSDGWIGEEDEYHPLPT